MNLRLRAETLQFSLLSAIARQWLRHPVGFVLMEVALVLIPWVAVLMPIVGLCVRLGREQGGPNGHGLMALVLALAIAAWVFGSFFFYERYVRAWVALTGVSPVRLCPWMRADGVSWPRLSGRADRPVRAIIDEAADLVRNQGLISRVDIRGGQGQWALIALLFRVLDPQVQAEAGARSLNLKTRASAASVGGLDERTHGRL